MMSCGEGDIELIGARHPCLEIQDDINFIANDVSLIRGIYLIICGRVITRCTQEKMNFRSLQDPIWEENQLILEWFAPY